MYHRVTLLSKEPVRFPARTDYSNIHRTLEVLFESAEEAAYELVEKYVTDAFESEDFEDFMENLQTFAKRATPQEVAFLMSLLTETHWNQLHKSPRNIPVEATEYVAAYWYLNNILAEAVPHLVPVVEAVSLKVKVIGNGEDMLPGQEDTGKYGEIYPFAARLLMDACSPKGAIGEYQLKGPIVEYFEKLKNGRSQTAVDSDAPYDFDSLVDDTNGIIWGVNVLQDPEDSPEGEDSGIYEIIIHPDWLTPDLKTNFEMYPYSDYS